MTQQQANMISQMQVRGFINLNSVLIRYSTEAPDENKDLLIVRECSGSKDTETVSVLPCTNFAECGIGWEGIHRVGATFRIA